MLLLKLDALQLKIDFFIDKSITLDMIGILKILESFVEIFFELNESDNKKKLFL
jgi:hypothetical protein